MFQSKRIFISFLALFIVSMAGKKTEAQNFEGIIHYKFYSTQGSAPANMEYMVKNDQVRWKFGSEGQAGAMLYNQNKSTMIFLVDKMHGYMEMNMDKMNSDRENGKWSKAKLNKTRQTKTIAGHSCQVWNLENDEGDTLTMCMAKGLGSFYTPGNPQKNSPDWAKEIMAEGYMPLQVMDKSGGKEDTKMEVTKIEKKSLDDSLFKIPEGYRDMSAMMKQMQKNER